MRLSILLLLGTTSLGEAVVLTEDFSSAPSTRSWEIFGEARLFRWDEAAQNLRVTWDSTKGNSFFRLPLGTVLSRNEDFTIAFDLQLDDVAAGVVPGKSSTFPLAIGLQNTAEASQPTFSRGNGSHSPNLVEFDFFPDTGFGPTVWPAIWSTNSVLTYRSAMDYTILGLPLGIFMRVTLSYTAADSTLRTQIATDGMRLAPLNSVVLSPTFTDFRVDAFSVTSYADAGQDTRFGGSLLAHGIVDNISLRLPPRPVSNVRGHFHDHQWEVVFDGRTHWTYVLEATENFLSWIEVSAKAEGFNGEMILRELGDTPALLRYYRVKAHPAP